MTGVVGSEKRTIGNLSRHIWEKVAMVLRRSSVEVIFVDVSASCCSPCPSGLVMYASYVKHVRETQQHIDEEGNDAGGGGEVSQVGVRRGGKSNMSIVFLSLPQKCCLGGLSCMGADVCLGFPAGQLLV